MKSVGLGSCQRGHAVINRNRLLPGQAGFVSDRVSVVAGDNQS